MLQENRKLSAERHACRSLMSVTLDLSSEYSHCESKLWALHLVSVRTCNPVDILLSSAVRINMHRLQYVLA